MHFRDSLTSRLRGIKDHTPDRGSVTVAVIHHHHTPDRGGAFEAGWILLTEAI